MVTGQDSRILQLSDLVPIEVGRIRLRPLETRDAHRYSVCASDPETERWAYITDAATTPEAVAARIEGQYRDDALSGRAVRLTIADATTDDYLGLMSFFDDRGDSVEIGFVLGPESRGRGVIGPALEATAELARQAGYTSLRGRTDVHNGAARRTLERAGYAPVGEPTPPVTPGFEHVRLQAYELPLTAGPTSPTSPMDPRSAALQEVLTRALRETGIPGAQAAIIHHGQIHLASGGVLNLRNGLGVTDHSLFQIGSVTKLFTTTLVLQLVDDGIIELTDPIARHVPEFRLADPEHTQAVRIIDLLQHRGGFDGDYFTDGGRGLDANRALIADLITSETFHQPGEQFAYSNAGMVLLGRLVEIARGTDYLAAVRERIYEPLGLEYAVTLPEEALLYGTAVGHTRDDNGDPVVIPTWQLPMSAAATGACLTMSAESMAVFGEMLVRRGLARDGTRVLSAEMAELMGRRAFSLPVPSVVGEGIAVGALTYEYDGAAAFGHDGHSIGQVTGLRIIPEADLVVAVTTNRENTSELTEAVIAHALREFAEAKPIPEPDLPTPPLEADERFIAGTYANHTMTATVTVTDGRARIRLGAVGIELGNQPAMRAHRIADEVYRVVAEEHGMDLKFLFTDSDGDGVADFLWFNRLLKRVDRP